MYKDQWQTSNCDSIIQDQGSLKMKELFFREDAILDAEIADIEAFKVHLEKYDSLTGG